MLEENPSNSSVLSRSTTGLGLPVPSADQSSAERQSSGGLWIPDILSTSFYRYQETHEMVREVVDENGGEYQCEPTI